MKTKFYVFQQDISDDAGIEFFNKEDLFHLVVEAESHLMANLLAEEYGVDFEAEVIDSGGIRRWRTVSEKDGITWYEVQKHFRDYSNYDYLVAFHGDMLYNYLIVRKYAEIDQI